MVARKEISAELEVRARHLYEQTLAPVDDISAMLGLSKSAFYKRVREWKWSRRRASAAKFEFARALTTAVVAEQTKAQLVDDAPAIDRTTLVARLLELVGHEMDLIDKVFKSVGEIGPEASDRTSRTIANLGRSLHEIHELIRPPCEVTGNRNDEADDDAVPLDIDQFRRELARRIDEFVDARRSRPGGAGGPPVGRNDGEET